MCDKLEEILQIHDAATVSICSSLHGRNLQLRPQWREVRREHVPAITLPSFTFSVLTLSA